MTQASPAGSPQEAIKHFAEQAFYVPQPQQKISTFAGLATELTAQLGFSPDLLDAQNPVQISPDRNYQPGLETYTPEDHLRGIVALTAEADLPPLPKADLINRVVNIAGRPRTNAGSVYRRAALKLRVARHITLGELHGMDETTEAASISGILLKNWYPNEPARLVANATAIFKVATRGKL